MKNKFFATLLISVFLLVPVLSAKALTADERAQLEAELKELEAVIAQKQIELNQQKAQSGSIKRDIDILTSQIDQARADIKAKQLQITKLGDEIFTKIRVIDDLEERQEKQKESLAELLRKKQMR